MTRRIAIGRIVGATAALGLIWGTAMFAIGWREGNRRFEEWREARPVTMVVDLSKPGTVTAPLRQTSQVSHGEAFCLTVPPGAVAGRKISELLAGLDTTITITDTEGRLITIYGGEGNPIPLNNGQVEPTGALAMQSEAEPLATGEPIELAYFHPFPVGDYLITLDVKSGAPALAGIEQMMDARYRLCGCERMGAAFCGFLAFVFGIPGIILTAVVVPGFIRHGVWKAVAQAVPDNMVENRNGKVTARVDG